MRGIQINDQLNYATFGQRFCAMMIDVLVFLPLVALLLWSESSSKAMTYASLIISPVISSAYTICGHALYGQTVGKYAMGIRVVRSSGDAIGWSRAWLRSSFELVFSAFGLIKSMVVMSRITDAEFYGVGWVQLSQNLDSHEPRWSVWVDIAGQMWIWSELIVILFNKKRRSLHDFLAGTVVISDSQPRTELTTGAEAVG